jgi:acetyl-CoA carboxylase carboxyl transferase subunit beta
MAVVQEDRASQIEPTGEKPSRVPEGLWVKCPGCAQIIYNKDLDKNQQVCPKCGHHFRSAPTSGCVRF